MGKVYTNQLSPENQNKSGTMKKALLLFLSGITALALPAQHETLFDDFTSFGAFGGPMVEISSINGEVGADVGGGGALVLDDFFIGGYGMGTDQPDITLQQDIGGEIQDITYNIRFKHGGLWFGYTPRQYKMGHLYTSLKVGWGKAQLLNQDFDTPRDRIFVLTPEVGAEFNLTNWFKLGFTGGYRWVNGISRLPTLDDSDFSSPTGTITFRFGGFGDGWEWD